MEKSLGIDDDKYKEIEERQYNILFDAYMVEMCDCPEEDDCKHVEYFDDIWDTSKAVQRKILLEFMQDKANEKSGWLVTEVKNVIQKHWNGGKD